MKLNPVLAEDQTPLRKRLGRSPDRATHVVQGRNPARGDAQGSPKKETIGRLDTYPPQKAKSLRANEGPRPQARLKLCVRHMRAP